MNKNTQSASKYGPNAVYLALVIGTIISFAVGFIFDKAEGAILLCVILVALLVYSVKRWSIQEEAYHSLRNRLKDRTNRYQNLLSILPEGILMLKDGVIDYANPAFEKHFLLKDIVGTRFRDLDLPEELSQYFDKDSFEHPILVPATTANPITREVSVLTPDDSHMVLVSYDISKENRINEMRRDFIANVSHELRTPLTVIYGLLESEADFAKNLTEEEKARFAKIIAHHSIMIEQSRRMRNILDDLLTISKLEGAVESRQDEPTVINVKEIVDLTVNEAQKLSNGRHTFEVNVEDIKLIAYEDEIRTALINLLTNAVRYTPCGGKIVVTWKETAQGAKLSVKDSGIGISQEHLPRLTERFYRVDQSRSRETGGTGLGLSIVKHILRHNNGELSIKSTVNVGSTFAMKFPSSQIIKQTL